MFNEKGYWLMQGDCLERMKEIESGSVDVTVTSPPYDNLRSYNGNNELWNDGVWQQVLRELYRVTASGGVVVWVVGDATIKGSETGTSFRQALFAIELGFNLHDTMIYEKAQSCFGSTKCYLQAFEFMFVFSKGRPKAINFIRDRDNVRGGKTESTVSRGFDKEGTSGERIYKTSEKKGKRKNIWKYGVGGGTTGHPAVFPEKLATDHVISWSNQGDVVFDPFMGSGTTGVACANTGRKFIGIELDLNYFNIALDRIEQAHNSN